MNHQNTQSSLVTFEDLQQHMESVDLDAFSNPQALLPPSVEQALLHLASVYSMVQPVLAVVGALPIFPSSWRRALALLLGAIEAVLTITDDPAFKAGRDLEQFKAGRDLEE
jgi:hypothetical protein